MKTQEQLQHQLYEQTTEVENALFNLNKADLILSYWTQEYSFVDQPDPREATAWGSAAHGEETSTKGEQSSKWYYEYRQIIGFIDIVYDYVIKSRELLEKVVYGGEGACEKTRGSEVGKL